LKYQFRRAGKNGGVLGEEIFAREPTRFSVRPPPAGGGQFSGQVSFLAFMNQIRQDNFKSL
jgi:hypothetical protein